MSRRDACNHQGPKAHSIDLKALLRRVGRRSIPPVVCTSKPAKVAEAQVHKVWRSRAPMAPPTKFHFDSQLRRAPRNTLWSPRGKGFTSRARLPACYRCNNVRTASRIGPSRPARQLCSATMRRRNGAPIHRPQASLPSTPGWPPTKSTLSQPHGGRLHERATPSPRRSRMIFRGGTALPRPPTGAPPELTSGVLLPRAKR